MKKTMIMAILVLATLVSNSQEFMGISVDGKLSDAVAKFKEKGFTTATIGAGATVMKGMMGTKEIELVICNTATTKTVWAFKVYLPKKDSWYSLKAEYLEFLDLDFIRSQIAAEKTFQNDLEVYLFGYFISDAKNIINSPFLYLILTSH